jgi:hypothetical protein
MQKLVDDRLRGGRLVSPERVGDDWIKDYLVGTTSIVVKIWATCFRISNKEDWTARQKRLGRMSGV